MDVVDVARVDRADHLDDPRSATARPATRPRLLDGREPGDVEVYLRAGVVQHARGRRPGPAALERRRARRWRGRAGRSGVTAPMPGKIVKVLVKPGDAVAARQGLVVIEAMKMENELRASRDGQVKDVHVAEGDLVEAGRLLTVIE